MNTDKCSKPACLVKWFGAVVIAASPLLSSADPACSGLGIETHGQHIIGDYVTGIGGISGDLNWPPKGEVGEAVSANGGAAVPGGPGPGFHFPLGLAPGASFCNPQAHPNGFVPPDTGND